MSDQAAQRSRAAQQVEERGRREVGKETAVLREGLSRLEEELERQRLEGERARSAAQQDVQNLRYGGGWSAPWDPGSKLAPGVRFRSGVATFFFIRRWRRERGRKSQVKHKRCGGTDLSPVALPAARAPRVVPLMLLLWR